MNIALVGYGKMGKTIEKIALERGHHIVLKIRKENLADMTATNLKMADVVIEFTNPESAKSNVLQCLNLGLPVVCGSTGWNHELPEANQYAEVNNTAFLHASNFSIGVNIFFEVNKLLAQLMQGQVDYKVTMEEVHHTEKKDAPSGTAITIAEQILSKISRLKNWALDINMPLPTDTLPIKAIRENHVPGTHQVSYNSTLDTIDIIHTAHNRDGFAKGAVLAAEFIFGKQGVFAMKDVLGVG
ncbi:MAG TPA: 4-hydroxy-tetrahydrodipicolinate reductase [Flavipsychrobacter sp.]|nr:4-hydroxy-tetrahydrodipicolinate reductase [Flavipsychrobacter sp.]